MIGKYQKKTLQISGVHNFEPRQFLRRLQNSKINAGLNIVVDGRTRIFLSVFDKSFLRKSNAQPKLDVIKNLLDGCSFEESIQPFFNTNYSLIHVVGQPVAREGQIEELVAKLLDTEIKSCIFVNMSSVQAAEMECPFRVTFSVAVSGQEELKKNVATAAALIQAIYDHNSIQLILDRRPSRNIKKLAGGGHIYSTVLDLEHASAYFQLPLTYGVESIKKMDFPLPNFPFEGIEIGESAEFNIREIDKVRLDPDRLFEHMAVWGASGTGKTTFLKNFLTNLEKTDVRFCVIDWHNEYRDTVTAMKGKLGEDIIILNPFLGSLSLNPLELPEKDVPKEILVWERIENFISLIKQMFLLGEIQEARLREALSSLYSETDSPTIGQAIAMLEAKKMKALTLKLGKFSSGFYGRIFNCRHSSLSFAELRKKNVIIELGQLPSEVRMFFACVFLILWWDNLRLEETTPNVLVLDDFYRYGDISVVRKMLSEARKFRQGIVCSHQGPYQLPKGIQEEVIRNTTIKVIFRQEQTWDKHIVRDALGGLTKEQLISLSYLETGQAIVKLSSLKFPMRIDVPPPLKTKPLEEWKVKRAMRKFIGDPEPYEEIKVERPFEKKFLEEIHKRPQAPLTEITKALGIKTRRGYALKDRLLDEGYLEGERIRQGKGRPRISLKLTKKGFEYIGREEKGEAPQHGKSEHVLTIKKIASILKDWNVEIEDSCDIKATKDGYTVAIEVETGKSKDKKQLLYNLRRDSDWADKVVIVCPNKKAKLKIEEITKDETTGDKTIITYRQIDKLNEILRPKLTMKLLNVFWEQSSIGGKLSTTGMRRLVMNCFDLEDSKQWEEKSSYQGKPKYPFWEQSINIQAQILALLKTHPEGRRIAEGIENQIDPKPV